MSEGRQVATVIGVAALGASGALAYATFREEPPFIRGTVFFLCGTASGFGTVAALDIFGGCHPYERRMLLGVFVLGLCGVAACAIIGSATGEMAKGMVGDSKTTRSYSKKRG
jgi:hypothetical protein